MKLVLRAFELLRNNSKGVTDFFTLKKLQMTRNQIKIKYDQFFGTGLWERDYKPHITVFTEQCVRESDAKDFWVDSQDELPEIGSRILARTTGGKTYYGVYSALDEFDLHWPDHEDDYRGKWFKYTKRTVIKWRYL